MNTNMIISSDKSVKAFYLFFIVHTIQVGAGLMGVPRILFVEAGVDSWISILVAGAYLHLVVWIMILILKEYENADILGIQSDLFGKAVGKAIGMVYLIYIFLILLSIMKNYIEVVQVFIFPEIPIWLMSLFLISLLIYSILGGFRVVVGVSFLLFFFTIWIVFTIYKPVTLMDWSHFTPIGQTNPIDILRGAQKTTYTMLGLEVLFFVYPYIKNKKDVSLPLHAGVFFTTSLVMLVTVTSIGYFSPDQLKETVWATLSMFKIVSFPIIERFDFIAVSLWMMVILPNIVLLCWMFIHTLKRLFRIPEKPSLYGFGILLFVASLLIEYRSDINRLTNISSMIGFWLVFVYPLFIYLTIQIKKLFRKENSL